LVDTSVWIDYFNGVASAQTDWLDAALGDGDVLMGDLILLEILQGIRSDSDYAVTRKQLSALEQVGLFGQHMVERCADNYRALRKKGVTIRKTADVIIASFCIDKELSLLFADRDFLPFVEHLGLQAVTVD
jgi:predicted nucleic acid-binding protein